MKRNFHRILSCIVAITLLAVSLNYLSDLLQKKDSDDKYKSFFEQEENFDVLFMGSSHVINGIFPMELWNDYGIVSYNFGGHGNYIPTTYWVMENALDYTTPQLVVIDCYYLGEEIKTNSNAVYMHLSLDTFPLSVTKFRTIKDLFSEEKVEGDTALENGGEITDQMSWEFLWDYVVYHDRWREVIQSDFDSAGNLEKGAESRIAVALPNVFTLISPDEKLEGETFGTEYLRKIIEDCQDRGIEVLLVYLPYPGGARVQKDANRVYDIAAEYGVNYINFLNLSVVDYSTDCYDEGSHLNPSGARKVTDYLGQYITEHYNISDQRTNEAYSNWFQDYATYTYLKINKIKEQKKLDNYLMLLADRNYNIMFEINDPSIWQSEYYTRMFENLGINSEMISDQTNFIAVREMGLDVNYSDSFHENGDGREATSIGEFRRRINEDGGYTVYRYDQELYSISAEQDADICIVLFDKNTMEVKDVVSFSQDDGYYVTEILQP